MALPSSGPISIGDINVEKGVSRTTANTSLQQLVSDFAAYGVDPNQPYAISEFYGKSYGQQYYQFTLSSGNTNFECSIQSSGDTVYGSNSTLENNTTLYTNTVLTTPYNGGGKYYYNYALEYTSTSQIIINGSGIVDNTPGNPC
jgi:hypothetical protein